MWRLGLWPDRTHVSQCDQASGNVRLLLGFAYSQLAELANCAYIAIVA